METRLSRFCDGLIEAGWLAALVVTPLFFNTYSSRVFEPDKLHLLRSLALLVAAAWLTQIVERVWQGRRQANVWESVRQTPLALPALALLAAYFISTALSVAPRISFFGSYVRMQGTFSFLSYVVLFGAVLTHLRTRGQMNRLIYTVVISSVPISIYALIQHYRLDPLPWGGDVVQRVAANMGNSIFVAAYLIMAFFLTLERMLDSLAALLQPERSTMGQAVRAGAYLFVMAIQLIAIVFTQSRGPWLGLAVGLYVFGMLGIRLLARYGAGHPRLAWANRFERPAWLTLIAVTLAGIGLLVVMNIPNGPLQSLRSVPYLGRMGTVFSTTEGTNAVRVLIWEGVVDLMLKPHAPVQYPDGSVDSLNALRPLFGYGPESMWVAYNPFYPPELGHFESRSASPDRSHNETFDALVRTGLLGFLAQMWLFGSIFYFALRWLGLVQGSRRRNLFVALLVGGAAAGVLIPAAVDGSLRLAGIGLPAGMIAGVLVYVTLDLLRPAAGAYEQPAGARRQLLTLALLAAIVAHFFEVHVGIAIASTLTHFWIFSAVLVVNGMGWIREEEAAPVLAARPVLGARPEPFPERQPVTAATGKRKKRSDRPAPVHAPLPDRRPAGRAAWYRFLPYVGIAVLVVLVITWDYLLNQSGARSAGTVLLNAFTTRFDTGSRIVTPSSALIVLLLFTWGVAAVLAVAEHLNECPAGAQPLTMGSVHVAASLGVFLLYGLIQAGRTLLAALQPMDAVHRLANHITFFNGVLLLLLLLLAGALAAGRAPVRREEQRRSGAVPAIAGAALAAMALLIAVNVNVQTVRADTYYKQALGYEEANSWDNAAFLYQLSAQQQPNEDYYYLFLGRSLLELAARNRPTTAALPANGGTGDPQQALALAARALQLRDREDLTRASLAVLLAAQRLNPLNTDHTANLARLYRSWAFSNVTTAESGNNAALRQLALTRPQEVDVTKLQQSIRHYQAALSLSKNNSGLWNELAVVQFVSNDAQGALASLDRSQQIDDRFYQTYVLRGEILGDGGDTAGALAAYRKANELQPNDPNVVSAIGVYSAQSGDMAGAIQAFDQLIAGGNRALTGVQRDLAEFDQAAARAGSVAALGAGAQGRRDQLQAAVNAQKSQLHLAYRNKAIVLRDGGLLDDAMAAAQQALALASDDQRAVTEQLIAELQKRKSG